MIIRWIRGTRATRCNDGGSEHSKWLAKVFERFHNTEKLCVSREIFLKFRRRFDNNTRAMGHFKISFAL